MKRHFLPHEEHGARAIFVSFPAIFLYLVFVVFLNAFSYKASVTWPSILGYATNISSYELLKETNARREQNGLLPLVLNSKLSLASQKKATNMFFEGYWAHISPKGETPWNFIIKEGYDYQYAGENLARDFDYSKSVVDAWMNSPSHKENILNPNYKEIGFAVMDGSLNGEKTTLVVQMFGTPRDLSTISTNSKTPEVSELAVFQVNPIDGTIQGVASKIDLKKASKSFSLFLGSFMLGIFVLDAWYIRKNKIHRLSGNTIAHILLLLVALGGIWYSGVGSII